MSFIIGLSCLFVDVFVLFDRRVYRVMIVDLPVVDDDTGVADLAQGFHIMADQEDVTVLDLFHQGLFGFFFEAGIPDREGLVDDHVIKIEREGKPEAQAGFHSG